MQPKSQREPVVYKTCPKCGENKMVKDSMASSGKRRWKCNTGCSFSTTNPDVQMIVPDKAIYDPTLDDGATKFVITWAQNATPVHKGFLRALRTYCKATGAALLVQAGRYKNPTSQWDSSQRNDQWWEPELVPYLINTRRVLAKNLVLLADVPTQPTDATPLTGFEAVTHAESGIVGHPKLQLVCVPTPHKRLPKIMTTTGACTVPNYTDSKAGKKGEFHHVTGAVVVELDGTTFHLRHLNARKDGAFCDLDKAYYPDGSVKPAGPYEGIVFGDSHARFADKQVTEATFGKKGLVEKLNPKTLVFHDLLDGYAINPHHTGKPFIGAAKMEANYGSISDEVTYTINWMLDKTKGRKAVIVPSNHDDFLSRWIDTHDWKKDPLNADFYLETALYMWRGTHMSDAGAVVPDPFHYWVKKVKANNVNCLPKNTSFTIAGIECGLHGHEGSNGAKGNIKSFAKIGAKTIVGHSHTCGISGGAWQTGTSTGLQLEYTGPVSSWLQAHVSINPFGKRALHICIDGKFYL